MRRFSIILAAGLTVLAAAAQPDTNAPAATSDTNGIATMADTNAVAAPTVTNAGTATTPANSAAAPMGANAPAAPMYTNAASADTATNGRAMSLQDCIQEALQHNLDVQIQRYQPQISLYNVRAAYGGYDPTFTFSGQHSYSEQGLTIQNGQVIVPTTQTENSFNSGLSGGTPWGMTYTLGGGNGINNPAFLSESYGQKSLGTFSTNFDSSSGAVGLSLQQPLLKNFWIDQTRLNIRLARNQLNSDEQGLRLQIITSVTAVENAYYELIYAQENVKVQQEALNLAETLLDQDRQRVQIGTVAEHAGTIEQDEAQVAQSRANLIAAQYTLVTGQNTLKSLLTDAYSQWHGADIQPTVPLTAPPQSFDLQGSWKRGMTERPDLIQKQLLVERQGIQLKFDHNQLYPEVDLVGSYGFNGDGKEYSDVFSQINQGNRPFYSAGAQLTIPLSNQGARNTYKSDKVTLQQLLLKLKQFEQNVLVEIDNAVKNAESTYQSVDASQQARIYAEAALDAEQKKYAVGKSTTFTVLQLQNNLTAARSQEIRALANYNQALANLAQQEGSTLERDRIDIQVK